MAGKLSVNTDELREILETFYTLTGIRPVIFDSDFCELMSYPSEMCTFCKSIREDERLCAKCRDSDIGAFKKCTETKDVVIYKCHAGLLEAAFPIKHGERIIGYIMFGQITDIKDKGELSVYLSSINEKYGVCGDISGIKYKNQNQIHAAAKLLEMCTNYILLKEMIALRGNLATDLAKEYIAEHLSEEISVDEICKYTYTSRTKLYDAFRRDCGVGIAAYIKEERLKLARELLRTTALSVGEVAEKAGFTDYNYFSRVFKKRFGMSPYKVK